MANDLVPIDQIERMGSAIAKSGLFGVKTQEQAVALMLIAQAEGLHPAIAARDYHVIQGRPALKADAMLARFQQAGGRVNWDKLTDTEVTGTFTHAAGGSATITWTIAQALKIGLASKDNWKNFPRAMLRARVVSEGIRTVYPGCVVGTYTPEEVQDFQAAPEPARNIPAPTEMVEAVEDDGAFALMVPDQDQAYARFHDLASWKEAYLALAKRIKDSAKLSDDIKTSKLHALKVANSQLFADHFKGAEYGQFISAIHQSAPLANEEI